jgi:DNA-binding transcriptional LysR family regulator
MSGHKKAKQETSTPELKWAQAPDEHDYPAAESFLRLIASDATAKRLAGLLSRAPTVHHPVKDILRAAGLQLLPADDPEVAKDLAKVGDGIALSPVLLVRGDLSTGRALHIADGYHRVCASYHLSENTEVPCRLAALPAAAR